MLDDTLGLAHRDAALVVDEDWDVALARHPFHLVTFGVQPLDPDALEIEVQFVEPVDDVLTVRAAFESIESESHGGTVSATGKNPRRRGFVSVNPA